MVLHDQRIVIGTTGLHPPVKECTESGNITGIPFLTQFQIGGIHIGRGIFTVEVHPLNSHRAAGTVNDLTHTGIRPVSFCNTVSIGAVHEDIHLNAFREDRMLHPKQFIQISTFQVVVASQINENTPGVFDFRTAIRHTLGDHGILAVLVFVRRIHCQIIGPLGQVRQRDLCALSFGDHTFSLLIRRKFPRHPFVPVFTETGQDDFGGCPGIVVQLNLEHIRTGLIFFHRFSD